jgi:hypothetical protein
MASTRGYRRNNRGQFASSGGKVTIGKSGGFASASHRANVAASRAQKARNRSLARKGAAVALLGGAAAVAASRGAKSSPTGNISAMRSGVRTVANIVKGRSQ